MSKTCIVTVWERLNEHDEWEHNHISEGFENTMTPQPKALSFTAQRSWLKGQWRKTFMHIMDDGKLEPIRES